MVSDIRLTVMLTEVHLASGHLASSSWDLGGIPGATAFGLTTELLEQLKALLQELSIGLRGRHTRHEQSRPAEALQPRMLVRNAARGGARAIPWPHCSDLDRAGVTVGRSTVSERALSAPSSAAVKQPD
jgi:hypothetical protein